VANRKPHKGLAGYVGERKHKGPDGGHIVILDRHAPGVDWARKDPELGRWAIAHMPGGNMVYRSSRTKAYDILKHPEGAGILPSEVATPAEDDTEQARRQVGQEPGVVDIGEDGRCTCDAATKCPLGRVGSMARCTEAELAANHVPTRRVAGAGSRRVDRGRDSEYLTNTEPNNAAEAAQPKGEPVSEQTPAPVTETPAPEQAREGYNPPPANIDDPPPAPPPAPPALTQAAPPVPAFDVAKAKDRAVRYLDALGSELNEEQRYMFVDLCSSFGLNPFLREIHGLVHWNKDKNRHDLTIVVGYEVYLKRAIRTGKVKGWRVWTTGDGRKLKAHILIRRSDWAEPFYHEVDFEEYAKYVFDKRESGYRLTTFWKSKPRTMLKKVVMAQGFRLCFPDQDEIAGLPYAEDEIAAGGEFIGTELPGQTTEFTEADIEQVAADKGYPTPPDVAPPPVDRPAPPDQGPSPNAEKPEGSEPTQDLEGRKGDAKDAQTMYIEMHDGWSADGALGAVGRFLVAKKWIREDQSLDDLTPNQIVRLYNNYGSLMDKFRAWLVANPPTEG